MMRIEKFARALIVVAASAAAFGAGAQEGIGGEQAPRVRVETSVGDFVIELDPNRAPITVAAFLDYVDKGHYDGLLMHRVVASFLVQGGGYTPDFEAKPTESTVFNESGNGLSNMRGTVGLARGNDPHSGSSEFYINLADNPDLNPRPTRWGYAVFGRVVEGMEVVDEIADSPTGPGGPFDRAVPTVPIVIDRMARLP